VIASLDWLLFNPEQIIDAIRIGNSQMRILLGKLSNTHPRSFNYICLFNILFYSTKAADIFQL